jgi:hypothetical protein
MKKVLSVLFLSLVAIPVLTVSKAAANNGDEGSRRAREEQLKQNDRLKFGERDHEYRGYEGRRIEDGPTSPGTGDPAGPGSGQSAPLDGGLSLLLAAGVGLGLKKVATMRRASREKTTDIPE